MTTKARQPESMTVADGSYGYRAKTPGGVMQIWFCMGTIPGREGIGSACVHSTRAEARQCPRRPKV